MYNHKGPGNAKNGGRESIGTLDQAFRSIDREGIPPSPTSRAQSTVAAINPEIETDRHICKYIQRTVTQEISREDSRRSLQATREVLTNALLDLFITDTAEIESGLKTTLYKNMEMVLTEMVEKRERWAKYLNVAMTAGLKQRCSRTHSPAVLWHFCDSRTQMHRSPKHACMRPLMNGPKRHKAD